jgi:hypothetical protein
MNFDEADQRFQAWLEARLLSRADLSADDIRIDIIRWTDGKSRKRYCVRANVLAVGAAHPTHETAAGAPPSAQPASHTAGRVPELASRKPG